MPYEDSSTCLGIQFAYKGVEVLIALVYMQAPVGV